MLARHDVCWNRGCGHPKRERENLFILKVGLYMLIFICMFERTIPLNSTCDTVKCHTQNVKCMLLGMVHAFIWLFFFRQWFCKHFSYTLF